MSDKKTETEPQGALQVDASDQAGFTGSRDAEILEQIEVGDALAEVENLSWDSVYFLDEEDEEADEELADQDRDQSETAGDVVEGNEGSPYYDPNQIYVAEVGTTVTSSAINAGGAAGASGAAGAAGAAGAVGVASSATVAATTTAATAGASIGLVGAGAAAGGVALAAGGGGGGGGGGSPAPVPTPPGNPYPGTDPETLDLGGGSGTGLPRDVHLLSVGAGQPTNLLNKTLVVDLGATSGSFDGTLYYTQLTDSGVVTSTVAYSDVVNVTGTALNDMISGSAQANEIDAGAGDDIVYAAGGADTLDGAAGNDWLLFSPLTRGSGSDPYTNGVVIDLSAAANASAPEVFSAVGFENIYGSAASDQITGDASENILAGGTGDDFLDGGAGTDDLFGGASTSTGDQITGGAGVDTFWVGYDINPVTRARQIAVQQEASNSDLFDTSASLAGISSLSGSAAILDWDTADTLKVSYRGSAAIGGLYNDGDWTDADIVDVSSAANAGVINIAAGAGNNELYMSSGRDVIWVGYQYSPSAGVINVGNAPTQLGSGTAIDNLWEWDSTSSARDAVYVAAGHTAVVAAADWSGDDVTDLRSDVTNLGVLLVSAGSGSNVLYGSAGVDANYGSSGATSYNSVTAGAGSDQYFVGYRWDEVSRTSSASASTDILYDFATSETLNVSGVGRAIIAGLYGQADWSGADTVNLSGVNVSNTGQIVVALGDSDDLFVGSSGSDIVYGGALAAVGNQLTGGAGADTFISGLNFDPVAGALTLTNGESELLATQLGADAIRDWDNANDSLKVGSRGVAAITGLYGVSDLTGNDTVDVSSATNAGLINLAAGAGLNKLYLSSGKDQVWVGYNYPLSAGVFDVTVDPASSSSAATDIVVNWDDQSDSRDTLNVASGSTAAIGYLEGKSNWNSTDLVDLREQVNNQGFIQVAMGASANTVHLSGGNDTVYVGYEQLDTQFSPRLSGAAVDTIYGWNARDWTLDFLATDSQANSGVTWNGVADSTDLTFDRLTVASGSTVHLASIAGMDAADADRWDGVDIVDLRSSVNNQGVIEIWSGAESDLIYGSSGVDYIYSGPGLDNVFGGDGDDMFFVGYSPAWAAEGADAAEPRIWDWQNPTTFSGGAGTDGDGMRVASGSFAVIKGLWGMDHAEANRWDGANTVDLRGDVINLGKVIVESSTGNDTIYGSTGVDYINPGAGRNDLDLGNGGADRIYLDSYLTRTQISGFSSDDKIYLDQRVLQSFIDARGINTVDGFDLTATGVNTGSVSDGQFFDYGNWITSQLTYENTFKATLRAYSADPRDPDKEYDQTGANSPLYDFGWTTNGAWNNDAYESAHTAGKVAVIGAGTASILIGNGLSTIPFVGPLLAIPFWVNGGLMLNDGINNVQPYLNPVYSGGVLDSGISLLSMDSNPDGGNVSAIGNWDSKSFLDFYDAVYQQNSFGFIPSLEVAGQQPGDSLVSSYTDPITGTTWTQKWVAPELKGVASYLTIFNGTETFIYLVASQDALIQNNETILLAQVNGQLTADQLVMYDGATDAEYLRYFDNTIEAPVFAPEASIAPTGVDALTSGKQVLFGVSYTQNSATVNDFVNETDYNALAANSGVTDLVLQSVNTNDNQLSVAVSFDKALVATDVVQFFIGGTQVGADITGQTGTTLTGNITLPVIANSKIDGSHMLSVKVTNEKGFESEKTFRILADTTAPSSSDISVSASGGKLYVSSPESGTVTLGGTTKDLTADNSNQTSFIAGAAATVSEQSLTVADIFGHSTNMGSVFLGTAGSDTGGNVIGQVDAYRTTSAAYVFGFGGNDVIQATASGAYVEGGAGEDILRLDNGGTVEAGTGADVIDLRSGGTDEAYLLKVNATNQDSNSTNTDVVFGFNGAEDQLLITATGVANFDVSRDVDFTTIGSVSPTVLPGVSAGAALTTKILEVDFNNNGGALNTGDLQVEFVDTYTYGTVTSALAFDLTGTSAANTLKGGGNNDKLAGGAGVDTLTGGAGDDRFIFGSGDSNATASGFDTITDVELADETDVDTVDLYNLPNIVADTAGQNGTDNTSGTIKSHAISNGVVTFDDADTFAAALTSSDFTLADAIDYLVKNLAGTDSDGDAVAFNYGADAYVFQNVDNNTDSTDIFVKLQGVNLDGLTTDSTATTTDYLYIA